MCNFFDSNIAAQQLPDTACDPSTTSCPTNPSDCIVQFFPKPDWQGEYGFDWLRDGKWPLSSQNKMDPEYKKICGKHFLPVGSPEASQHVDTDINSYAGEFREQSVLYGNMENYFYKQPITYNDGSDKAFFASFLTMTSASVQIKARVKDVLEMPDSFELDSYDKNVLSIDNIPTGSGDFPINISIKNNQRITTQQTVHVKAVKQGFDPKIVGKLIILPNDDAHIKDIPVLLIRVKTAIPGLLPPPTGNTIIDLINILIGPPKGTERTGRMDPTVESFLRKTFSQGLIQPKFNEPAIPNDANGKPLDLLDFSTLPLYSKYFTPDGKGVIIHKDIAYLFGTITNYNTTTGSLEVEPTVTTGQGVQHNNWQVRLWNTADTFAIGGANNPTPAGNFRGSSATSITIPTLPIPLPTPKPKITLTVESGLSYTNGQAVIIARSDENIASPFVDIRKACYAKFQQNLRNVNPTLEHTYDNHVKLFFFDEGIFFREANGSFHELGGEDTSPDSPMTQGFAIVGNRCTAGAAVHEILHDLGLPHTFDGGAATGSLSRNARFTYKGRETENIMDYTFTKGGGFNNVGVSLYHWQWKVINDKI